MNNKKFAVISIFSALIIILQIISTYVNFGGFPITLTLIPIIISGAVYGIQMGSLMGLVFGMIVSFMVIVGADPSGAVMFATHPIITVLTCLIKGAVAGGIGALAYKKIKNKKISIVVDAVITPIFLGTLLIVFL